MKMKKNLWMLMALLLVSVFMGCSNGNDEDNLGGSTGNNGDSGVPLLEKKITKIVEKTESWGGDEISTEYNFIYDEQDRLVKIVENEGFYQTKFTYEADKVLVEKGYRDGTISDSYAITLQNNRAVETKSGIGESWKYAYSEDGYLSRIAYIDEMYSEGFVAEDGILAKIDGDLCVPYEDAVNNTNLDLHFYIGGGSMDDYAIMLGITGKRFRFLPQKIENSYYSDFDDLVVRISSYSYDISPDGYITEIKEYFRYGHQPEEETELLFIYEITYEE